MIDPTALVAPKGFAPHTGQTSWGKAWQRLSGGPPVQDSDDLQRIVTLPRRPQEEEDTERGAALIASETSRYSLDVPSGACRCAELDPDRHAAEGCVDELRLAQAWALREIRIVGGLFGPIGVGHGKTILDILAPLALERHGVRVVLLLVPPGLVTQLIGDYEYAAQHFLVPGMVIHGFDYTNVIVGRPTLHVLPYSRLQLPASTAWLEQNLRPDAIIADEAHRLRDLDRAGASRVGRYMEDHTTTRFCGWSGSITDKSVNDYAHLLRWALRMNSPLPLDPVAVDDWGRTIDAGCEADPGALLERFERAGLVLPGEHIRDGFRRRLNETLGVVSTKAPAVKTRLEISERYPIFEGREIRCVDEPGEEPTMHVDDGLPDPVRRALQHLRATWVRPDGEELVDALQVAKTARELACGFYYHWIFPHNKLPDDEELIDEWVGARKEYHKELRWKLKGREEHLDSPLLCEHAAQRYWGDRPRHKGLPVWHAKTWPRWRDVKKLVRPETEAIRLHDYLARDAAAWGREHTGIIWYDHAEFGRWVSEISAESGQAFPIHGGGPNAGRLIKSERGDRTIVASIKAHGTGRNGLQFIYGEQLVEHVPSSGATCEQLLGRLHRVGQPRDVVRTWFYAQTAEMMKQLDDALSSGAYVRGTIGAEQKLAAGLRRMK
jgi:hypothetical protein